MRSRRPIARLNRGRVPRRVDGGGPPPTDTDPPGVFGNLVIAADGLSAVITLDEDCDETSVPAPGDFALAGTPALVDGVSYTDATHIELTFDSPILGSETVTWDYTAGVDPIQDLAGNDLPNVSGGAATNGSGIELETVVLAVTGSWSITDYAPHRPVSGLTWAAGGGGDGNGARVATGGAGELRIWDITDPDPGSISGTTGAGGTAGTGGNATNGGDSTVSDVSGVVVTAIGGSAGNAATNVAGAGGTGGTGGTGRAGGDGATNVGGNTLGGASSGAATAASGNSPGEPDGFAPALANISGNPMRTCGGCGSSANVGFSGGDGHHTVVYQRAVVAASRPRCDSISWGRDVSTTTARNVTLPGSYAAGDRLIVHAGNPAASGACSMAGYTELVDAGTAAAGLCYVRDADGSDPVALASGNVRTTWSVWRIRGAAAVANCSAGSNTTATAQSNPPSHDHGSIVDALWFGCATWASSTQSNGAGDLPANYAGVLLTSARTSAGGAFLVVGMRPLLSTQTEDPGQITTAGNVSGAAWTMCIPA